MKNSNDHNTPQNNANFDDQLDGLLRDWHSANADQAAAQRDKLLQAVTNNTRQGTPTRTTDRNISPARRIFASPHLRVAAVLAFCIVTSVIFFPATQPSSYADNIRIAPDGGRLDALDGDGNIIGPCALEHTDVDAEISGFLSRVTVTQRYYNPYDDRIEAIYTFPLSHRAAVDRMTMTIGDRVIEGKVRERTEARAIYQAARDDGFVAALLEQERPNIFTQSVANIEPGQEILIEISYVETLQETDGVFSFDFPMVVGPRYIPGKRLDDAEMLPEGLDYREGVALQAPAHLSSLARGAAASSLGDLTTNGLERILVTAIPIHGPENNQQMLPDVWYSFDVSYFFGHNYEHGVLYSDGTGQIESRWFYFDPRMAQPSAGTPATPTDQVPDADRVSAMPVRPTTRAGHDISVTVTIDTGGPDLLDIDCVTHDVVYDNPRNGRTTVELRDLTTIPNRDFVLTWTQDADEIEEAVFTHAGELGNFLTLILQPPQRVTDDQIVPRELIFVMDTSGSMDGEPIEKSKELINRAIEKLHPDDTFNLITFAGDTKILWGTPKPATDRNIAEAQQFVTTRAGCGCTKMMQAINTALTRPEGYDPETMRIVCFLTDGYVGDDMAIIDAVRQNADTTRVFSLAIGNSTNRYLLDEMAQAGNGAADFVLLEDDIDDKIDRFLDRIHSPVLIDIDLEFSDGLTIHDQTPATVHDLFDHSPLIVHARYDQPASGTLTIRGTTADGHYERIIPIELPQEAPEHDTIASFWARARVDDIMNQALTEAQQGRFPEPLKKQVIDLGETFGILTPFTSFVAVDREYTTDQQKPRQVTIPTEHPDGMEDIYTGHDDEPTVDFTYTLTAKDLTGTTDDDLFAFTLSQSALTRANEYYRVAYTIVPADEGAFEPTFGFDKRLAEPYGNYGVAIIGEPDAEQTATPDDQWEGGYGYTVPYGPLNDHSTEQEAGVPLLAKISESALNYSMLPNNEASGATTSNTSAPNTGLQSGWDAYNQLNSTTSSPSTSAMMGGGMSGGGNTQPFSGGGFGSGNMQPFSGGGCFSGNGRGSNYVWSPRELAADDLMETIRNSIAPDDWRESGGTCAAISEFNGKLIVTTIPSVHHQIARLLHAIRTGHMPNHRIIDPDTPQPIQDIYAALDKPMSPQFSNTKLGDAFAQLSQASNFSILPIWEDLEGDGISADLEITLSYRSPVPLEQVIQDLLEVASGGHVRLDYMVQNGSIKIASRAYLMRNPTIEIYDVSDLLDTYVKQALADIAEEKKCAPNPTNENTNATTNSIPQPTAQYQPSYEENIEDLLETIRDTIEPDSWRENGGTIASVAELNGQLIVNQTPDVHRQLAKLLRKLHSKLPTAARSDDKLPINIPTGISEQDRIIFDKLQQAHTLALPESTSLKEALDLLSKTWNVTIHPIWLDLTDHGITDATQIHWSHNTEATLHEALSDLLTQISKDTKNPVTYTVSNGNITIATYYHQALQTYIEIYNVQNLLTP